MANIKPFCGYRYNPEKINNIGEVTTPPYDMISGSETDAFYNASEYNIIRAVKGKEFASDTGENNCYTRAGEFFRKLIEDNIIIQDPDPAFYLYEQSLWK